MPVEVIFGIIIFITVFLLIVIISDTLFATMVGENARTAGIHTRIKSGITGT